MKGFDPTLKHYQEFVRLFSQWINPSIFQRKKEYNLDKLKKIRNNFSLCAKIINGYVVDGKKKPEEITREILMKIKNL